MGRLVLASYVTVRVYTFGCSVLFAGRVYDPFLSGVNLKGSEALLLLIPSTSKRHSICESFAVTIV